MKLIYFLFIITSLFSIATHAQTSSSPLETRSLSEALLETLILEKINAHRQEKTLGNLQTESALVKAAANHSSYQGSVKMLTHEQKNASFKTPSLRVAKFGGNFNLVGENVALVPVYSESTYATVAEAFFQAWMNSPPHYENIIAPNYEYSGIRFRLGKDPKTRQPIIYATHVFAGLKARFFSKVVSDNYGLSPFNNSCKAYNHTKAIAEVLANFIVVKKDSVYLHYHNLKHIEQYFLTSEQDGFAIDIVERKQFPCDQPNLTSAIGPYQGVSLPPKFKKELLANNPMHSQNKFLAFLGVLPKGLVDNYQLNVISVRNNCACSHSSYLEVPVNDIPLVKILPVWHTTFKINNLDYKEAVTKVQFAQGKSSLDNTEITRIKNLISTHKKSIQRVHIFATSSIEGSSEKNEQLGIDRAQYIKQLFEQAGYSPPIINYHTLERWDLFRQQIKGTPFAFLLEMTNTQIQRRLNTDKKLLDKVDYLLAQQRQTQITLKISTEKAFENIQVDEVALLAQFEQLLEAKEIEAALEVQSKMVYAFVNDKLDKATLLATKIPLEKAYSPMLSNQIAVELFFSDYIPHSVLVPNWGDPFFSVDQAFVDRLMTLVSLSETDLPLQYNLSAFAIKYMRYTRESILDVTQLYQKILGFSDVEIYGQRSTWNQVEINRLKLNFHLAAADYFYQKFEYEKRDNSLKYVRKHYASQDLKIDESLYLAKYFNQNYRFTWAIDLLKNSLKTAPNHEDTYFTYVQTSTLEQDFNQALEKTYLEDLEKALTMNSSRWCTWMNTNYQLMHNAEFKAIYCKRCLDH
ncbi:MAG: CAP domain-containing protein [Aureispira sp.]